MKVLFKTLEGCVNISTLKLQCNGMTYTNFCKLVGYLNADSCPVVNAFFDWNPVYTDDYAPGKE